MPGPLSASDAVSPAIERAKRQLFKPFRLRYWLRLTAISLITGEFAGSGGCSFQGNYQVPWGGRGTDTGFWELRGLPVDWISKYLPWLILAVGVVVILGLLWLYLASVFRFILFDAVLTGDCRLRGGWRRWQERGTSLFWFQLLLGLTMLVALGVLVGGAALIAVRGKVFEQAREHVLMLMLGILIVVGVSLILVLGGSLISLLVRDFAVPIMALENIGVAESWRRLWPMLAEDKGGYVFYVVMKIVLAIAVAIVFGIITAISLLGLLIPTSMITGALYLLWKALGWVWHPSVPVLAAVAVVLLVVVIWVSAFVTVPAMVFWQSYVLNFFAGRYPKLAERMFPLPPVGPAPGAAPAG